MKQHIFITVFVAVLCIANANASIYAMYYSNPECLGPISASFIWQTVAGPINCSLVENSNDPSSILYISSIGTCNTTGVDIFDVYGPTDSHCSGSSIITMPYNTSCHAFSAQRDHEPWNPSAIFSCDAPEEVDPWVQVKSYCTEYPPDAFDPWIATWRNLVDTCVPLYNTSAYATAVNEPVSHWVKQDSVCRHNDTSAITYTIYNDHECTQVNATISIAPGCTESIHLDCDAPPVPPQAAPVPSSSGNPDSTGSPTDSGNPPTSTPSNAPTDAPGNANSLSITGIVALIALLAFVFIQ
jgi:hypothetical protein